MAQNTTNKNSVVRMSQEIQIQKELQSDGSAIVIPGMILERTSTTKRCKAHATAGGNVNVPLIALEDSYQGKTIDDGYAATAGEKIKTWIPRTGDEAHLILVDGQSIAIGDPLESDGTGRVQKHVPDVDAALDSDDPDPVATIYTKQIIGTALEAKDLSDSSGAEDSGTLDYDFRIAVEMA